MKQLPEWQIEAPKFSGTWFHITLLCIFLNELELLCKIIFEKIMYLLPISNFCFSIVYWLCLVFTEVITWQRMLCLYYLIFCIANWLPWYHLRCIPNQLSRFTLSLQSLDFLKGRHTVPQFWMPKWLWLQVVPIVRARGWVKPCDCSPEMQLACFSDRGQRQGRVKD